MYIKKFEIKNFRGISYIELCFQQGLNILIGENNAGKTAIIDALRICLNYGNIQRDKYFNKDFDFFIDKSNSDNANKEVQFDLHFQVEDENEISIYRELLNVNIDGSYDLQLHFKYYMDKEKLRYKVWGGSVEGQHVNSDVLQLINYIHLDALRNVEQDLKPYKGSKLSTLYDGLQEYDKAKKKISQKKLVMFLMEKIGKILLIKVKKKLMIT